LRLSKTVRELNCAKLEPTKEEETFETKSAEGSTVRSKSTRLAKKKQVDTGKSSEREGKKKPSEESHPREASASASAAPAEDCEVFSDPADYEEEVKEEIAATREAVKEEAKEYLTKYPFVIDKSSPEYNETYGRANHSQVL